MRFKNSSLLWLFCSACGCVSLNVDEFDHLDGTLLSDLLESRSLGPANSESIITILRQIKLMMEAGNSTLLQRHWNYKFNALSHKTDQAIVSLRDQFKSLASSTKQTVDTILGNVSALRMLLTDHGQQLSHLRNKLELIKDIKTSNAAVEQEKSSGFYSSFPKKDSLIIQSDYESPNSYVVSDVLNVSPSAQHSLSFSDSSRSKSTSNEVQSKFMQNVSYSIETLTSKVHQLTSDVTLLKVNSGKQALQLSELQKSTDQILSEKDNWGKCTCSTETFATVLQSLTSTLGNIQNSKYEYKQNEDEIYGIKDHISLLETNIEKISGNIATLERDISEVNLVKSEFPELAFNISNLDRQVNNLTEKLHNLTETDRTTTQFSSSLDKLCVSPYLKRAGSCYFVDNRQRLKWDDAREHCKKIQGDLAAPKDFFSFKRFMEAEHGKRRLGYWIGAKEEQNIWKWIDGRFIAIDDNIWEESQLSTDPHTKCMEIIPTNKFKASTLRCLLVRPFVCQQIGS